MNLKSIYYFLILFIFCLWIAIFNNYDVLLAPDTFNDDVIQFLWWMRNYSNIYPSANEHYFSISSSWTSLAYKGLFAIFSPIVGISFFSKFIGILLVFITGFFSFNIGKIVNRRFGLTLALFMLGLNYSSVSEGLPRSFRVPLILMFIYALVSNKNILMALILIFASLIYPVAFLLLFFVGAIYLWSYSEVAARDVKTKFFLISTLIGIFISLYFKSLIDGIETPYYRLLGPVKIFSDYLFSEGARSPVLNGEFGVESILFSILGNNSRIGTTLFFGGGHYERIVAVFLTLTLYTILRKEFRIPPSIKALLASGFICYILSFLLLKKLHWPQRYMEPTLSISLAFLIATNLDFLIAKKCTQFSNSISLLISLAYIVYLYFFGFLQLKVVTNSELKSTVVDVQNTFLGPPKLMDRLFYSNFYKFYISYEFFHKTNEIQKRMDNYIEIYYSNNLNSVRDFCKQENISNIIIDKREFNIRHIVSQKYPRDFSHKIESRLRNSDKFILLDIFNQSTSNHHLPYFIWSCRN